MSSPAFKTMSSSASWEWPTPKAFYEQLDAEFHFDFDPCPLGGEVDGRARLFNPWTGKRVFCNPPYGPEIPKFLNCWKDAELAVFLVPARVDTRWFHDICLPFAKETPLHQRTTSLWRWEVPRTIPEHVSYFQ